MCGIAGVYDPNGIDISSIEKISLTIRHRGPDDEGYMFLDAAEIMIPLRGEDTIEELTDIAYLKGHKGSIKLALIHRRLSIIDLSSSGHQPMLSPDGTLAVVYNGEIYNYIELRAELEKSGYTFRSGSDTEVILAAYQQWGEECVKRFIGMWAFVIFDRPKNILFCSRDRFGIKPFYYIERKGYFAFASEIKALFAANKEEPVLHRPNAIGFLVNSNQNFSGSTFISGIYELLPGHNLAYNLAGNNSVLKHYYKLNKSDDLNGIFHDEAVSMFSRLINDSINLHLRSDVPVGSCLSGGLDSSTIIAHLAGKELPGGLSTFTASFPGTPIDECQYINKLKNLYEFSDHYTYPDLKKLISETDLFLWHQDLPVQSTSMFAQWEVMKLANHHQVKVLLDGQGMDEILGGYSEFIGAYLLGQLSHLHFGKFFRTTKDLRDTYRTSRVANELARALFYYIPGPLRYRIYSSKRTGPSLISKEYKNAIKDIKFKRRISNSIRETSLISINNILPVLLRYEDRNSMAFSVESRVPFLDHRFVEFCVNLPEDLKIYNGWTKYLLRKSSEKRLPPEITWRKEKIGFATPERLWMDDLGNELMTFIKDQNIPDIISREMLFNAIKSGTEDRINLGEIWKILLFIRWYNVFNLK